MGNDELKKVVEDYISDYKVIPNKNGLIEIKIKDLILSSINLADNLLDNFYNTFPLIKNTLREKHGKVVKSFNIISNKQMKITPIQNLLSDKDNKLLKFQGFIVSSSDIITKTSYNYKCNACKKQMISQFPLRDCKYCRNYLHKSDCTKIIKQYREFLFQEKIPNRLFCENIIMKFDLTDNEESAIINFPDLFGNNIEILGTTKLVRAGKGVEGSHVCKTIIEVQGIKILKETLLSENRKKEVRKFIKKNKDDIIKICANHITCNIYGYEWEKQALMLTVTGLKKDSRTLSGRNTQMVTIMISNAGKGKSNLSKKFLDYLPNTSYITANTSKAGLGGGIEKSANGTYTFTIGELAYCNNSFAILDEIDNMEKEQADIMLTIISEGLLKVTKIKKFEMPIHVNFIIQGNPKNSEFDPNVPFFSQITLTSPFLDRGEFIIILHDPYDESNEEQTLNFANAVLTNKEPERKYDDDLIKDIVFYIKNFVDNPEIDNEANKIICEYWLKLKEMRNKLMDNSSENREYIKPVGARSLVSIAKISIAVSRFRLNKKVTAKDIEMGYDIFYNASIKNLIKDFGGFDSYSIKTVNIKGEITTPESKSQLMEWIPQYLSKQKNGEIETELLIKYIEDKFNFKDFVIDELIEKLKMRGDIYYPDSRGFKIKLL